MSSNRSGASYKPSSSSQKGHRCAYGRSQSDTEGQGSGKEFHNNKLFNSEADDTILPSKRAETATRSLLGHLQSQPEGLQQCTSAQRVPDPCRSVEKLHELIPDCKEIPGSSQHLQVTQWIESIDGKEEYDAFNSRMEEKNPPPPKQVPRPAPVARSRNSNVKKQPQAQNKGKGKAPAPKPYSQGYRMSKIQKDAMENVFQMAQTMMELKKNDDAR
ncbi:hypothetical protein O181_116170 [Austropuccinia psidii MF-1]|uniref:Uncharacterized protein n=1 Tax=Austropuccinia psidii MF-1 TaxID=1389203 RepID=A0A9Q3PX56_9BASI|nr:hypothetical protein [Austropuccinia psidii MF-1]